MKNGLAPVFLGAGPFFFLFFFGFFIYFHFFSMEQERVAIADLDAYFAEKFKNY